MGALYKCNECGNIEPSVVGEGFTWQAPGGRWIFTLKAKALDAGSMPDWQLCFECAIKALAALQNGRACAVLQAELSRMDEPCREQAGRLKNIELELARIAKEIPSKAESLEYERQRVKESREKYTADVERLRATLTDSYESACQLKKDVDKAQSEERKLVEALTQLRESVRSKRATVRQATKELPAGK